MAQAGDEVTVEVGTLGKILAKPSPDWWTVESSGKQGLVPAAYVSEVIGFAVAEYELVPQEKTELGLKPGDKVFVLEKLDADWWVGFCSKAVGLFPSAYVREVSEEDLEERPAASIPPAPMHDDSALLKQLEEADQKIKKLQSKVTELEKDLDSSKRSQSDVEARLREKIEMLNVELSKKNEEISALQNKLAEKENAKPCISAELLLMVDGKEFHLSMGGAVDASALTKGPSPVSLPAATVSMASPPSVPSSSGTSLQIKKASGVRTDIKAALRAVGTPSSGGPSKTTTPPPRPAASSRMSIVLSDMENGLPPSVKGPPGVPGVAATPTAAGTADRRIPSTPGALRKPPLGPGMGR